MCVKRIMPLKPVIMPGSADMRSAKLNGPRMGTGCLDLNSRETRYRDENKKVAKVSAVVFTSSMHRRKTCPRCKLKTLCE